MQEHLKPFFLLAIIILVIDLLWINYIVGDMWKKNVETVQKSPMEIRKQYALLSYVLIIFGIYYFVQMNTTKETYIKDSLVKGFIYGFILYGVFDFTNLAIFKEFDLKTAMIDMVWGGVLTASALLITNKILYSL
jgi:uncharacterized membrane protein